MLLVDGDGLSHELAPLLEGLGYEPVCYTSVCEAAENIVQAEADGLPFSAAVVELIARDGSSGLARKAALRAAGLCAPVVLSSDSEVRGHREHGFAGVVRRPYTPEEVRKVLRDALRP